MTVEVTRIRLFFQRFSLVFYLGQIGIRQIIEKVSVGSLIILRPFMHDQKGLRCELPVRRPSRREGTQSRFMIHGSIIVLPELHVIFIVKTGTSTFSTVRQ